jgi:alpha-ketoglutarate-dependent taurine dioxygenase
MQIRPLKPSFGAEILNVDLSRELDDAIFREIEDAFNHYSVVLFRDQHLTDEEHVRFSRRLASSRSTC